MKNNFIFLICYLNKLILYLKLMQQTAKISEYILYILYIFTVIQTLSYTYTSHTLMVNVLEKSLLTPRCPFRCSMPVITGKTKLGSILQAWNSLSAGTHCSLITKPYFWTKSSPYCKHGSHYCMLLISASPRLAAAMRPGRP